MTTQIEAAVAATDFGKPAAAKRGRNSAFPYVPVVDHGSHTEQVIGRAYATRDEALAEAGRVIEARREHLRTQLAEPRMRALRRQHGLSEEACA